MDRKKWIVLMVASIPLAMGAIDQWGTVIAIPELHRSLGASYAHLRLLFLAFWLPDLLVMAIAGRFGESIGYRKIYLGGLIIFALTSAISAAMTTIEGLIVIRAFKGVGAGLMFAPLMALIADTFPVEQQGKAFGLWAGLGGIFFALAPPLTGLLVVHFSWQAIYLFNAILAFLALILAWPYVENIRYLSMPRHYWKGLCLLLLGLSTFSIGIFQADTWGWFSLTVFLLFVLGLAILLGFGYHETRQRSPLIAIRCLANRNYLAGTLTAFIIYATQAAFMVATLFLFHLYFHLREDMIGVTFLAYALTWAIASFFTGIIADRIGLKRVLIIGLLITTLALLLCSVAHAYFILVIALIGLGIGISLSLVPANALAMSQIPPKHRGEASGTNMVIRLIGSLFGLCLFGCAFSTIQHASLTEYFLRSGSRLLLSYENQRHLLETVGLAITNNNEVNLLTGFDELSQAVANSVWVAFSDTLRLMAISLVIFTVIIGFLSKEGGKKVN